MLRVCALVTLFLSLCGASSAKTHSELLSEKPHFNDLEGSGFHGLNKLHPDKQDDGSGFASGDDADMDGREKPIDDEDDLDNRIDESESDVIDNVEGHIENNEVQLAKNAPAEEDIDNRIALASTNNNGSVFESTEMLAAMIAGGTIGLLFAILLILLLVYRMRKKDEGSYDLSKKPIYKKAPTTEFYA
ncbi:syndecan-4 [Scyliorhinus canicula]|uniref:syndecan-4 n=1 Tax=Scyliorhinus canicula TaxID=7830 RepID=UPI0018F4764E|nr:syndecan-4 [Scyliorhinus canicula]